MATPWLFSLGFTVVMASLGAKLWRINKIFNSELLRQTVTAKQALVHAGVLFGLNFVILVAWQIKAPRKYVIRSGEEEWDLYGACTSTDTAGKVFGGLILALNLCALLVTSYLAWKARNISSDFSESKHLGMALFCWVELLLVGLPVLFLIDNANANAYYFLEISIIFAITMTMLLIIFLPQVLHVRECNKTTQGGMRRSSSVRISGLDNQGASSTNFFLGDTQESPQRSRVFVLSTLGNSSPSNRAVMPPRLANLGGGTEPSKRSSSGNSSSQPSAEFVQSLDDSGKGKLKQIIEASRDEEIAKNPEHKNASEPTDSVIPNNASPDLEAGTGMVRKVVTLGA